MYACVISLPHSQTSSCCRAVIHAQVPVETATLVPVSREAGATTIYAVSYGFDTPFVAGDTLNMTFPPRSSFRTVTATISPSTDIPCTTDIDTLTIRCTFGGLATGPMTINYAGVVNPPYAVTAPDTASLVAITTHTDEQTSVTATREATVGSWTTITAAPIRNLLFIASSLQAGTPSNYTVNMTLSQLPAVTDQVVFGFPPGTTLLDAGAAQPWAYMNVPSGGATFSSCSFTTATQPLMTCTFATVTAPPMTEGQFVSILVTNIRLTGTENTTPPRGLRAQIVSTSTSPPAAATAIRDSNTTGISLYAVFRACTAGTYSVGDGSCVSCTPGKYSDTENAPQCTECAMGSFGAGNGRQICETCPTGSFANVTGLAACYACGLGTEAPVRNLTACTPCVAGKIAAETGRPTCTQCLANTYAPSEGLSQCTACETGKAAPLVSSTTCDSCVAGLFRVDEDNCEQCPAGKFTGTTNKLAECNLCGTGETSVLGATVCTQCLEGSYANVTGSPLCSLCDRGTVAPSRGRTICSPCGIGQAASEPGLDRCETCGAGKYGAGAAVECASCEIGKAQNLESQGSCNNCAMGSFASEPGQSICRACPAGRFSNDTALNTGCYDCVPGRAARSPASSCTPCTRNTYAPNYNMSDCLPCTDGLQAPRPGAIECVYIPPGCEPGTYNVSLPQFQNTTCWPCGEGSFAKEYNQFACDPCPLGQYQNEQGMSFCKNCTSGTWTPTLGQVICPNCTSGRFSNESRASSCYKCRKGESTLASGLTVCADCVAGTVAPIDGTPACLSCPLGKYTPVAGTTTCRNCPAATSTATTGTVHLTECQTISCGAITIPAESNLTVSYQDRGKGIFNLGSIARFSCPSEFILVGPSHLVCSPPNSASQLESNLVGVWAGPLPACIVGNLSLVPIHLNFTTQPPPVVVAGAVLLTSPTLSTFTEDGLLAVNATPIVNLTLMRAPGGGVVRSLNPSTAISTRLRGTTVKPMANGVVVFSDLFMLDVGDLFYIQATAPGFVPANSTTFNVTSGVASRLVLGTPQRATLGSVLPSSVTVRFTDAAGFAKTSDAVVTLGIVESDFWLGSGPVGSTLTATAVDGVATFSNVLVATSRTLGRTPVTFSLWASAPEFARTHSAPIAMFGSADNNRIQRLSEFARPAVFTLTVAATPDQYAGTLYSVFKAQVQLDVCNSLSMGMAACERVRVMSVVSNDAQTSATISFQIDPPARLAASAPRTPSVSTQSIAHPHDDVVAGRPTAVAFQGSDDFMGSYSDVDVASSSVAYGDVVTGAGTGMQLQDDTASSTTSSADSATPTELVWQLEAQLASSSSLLYKGSVTSGADADSLSADLTGSSASPTLASLVPVSETSSSSSIESSTDFIAGLSAGLGGLAVVAVLLFIYCVCIRKKSTGKERKSNDIELPARREPPKPPKQHAHPAGSTLNRYSMGRPQTSSTAPRTVQKGGFSV